MGLYPHYLLSDCWKLKRLDALRRANFICQVCDQRPADQAHHLTYARIGNEAPHDLLAVCDECHRKLHHKPAANDNNQKETRTKQVSLSQLDLFANAA